VVDHYGKIINEIQMCAYMCVIHFTDGSCIEISHRHGDELEYKSIPAELVE
jgi:hypothetical protein